MARGALKFFRLTRYHWCLFGPLNLANIKQKQFSKSKRQNSVRAKRAEGQKSKKAKRAKRAEGQKGKRAKWQKGKKGKKGKRAKRAKKAKVQTNIFPWHDFGMTLA